MVGIPLIGVAGFAHTLHRLYMPSQDKPRITRTYRYYTANRITPVVGSYGQSSNGASQTVRPDDWISSSSGGLPKSPINLNIRWLTIQVYSPDSNSGVGWFFVPGPKDLQVTYL